MRTFAEVFHAHQGRLVDKWEHYFPIYDKHFAKYQNTEVRVLEIGVSHGGSLQIWKEYFGPKAAIWGIDIDPRCKAYEEDQIGIEIMDQSKVQDMTELGEYAGPFDIVIDDGSHIKEHQETSFKALWPDTSGVYLIEDCHHGYPKISVNEPLKTHYKWVLVMERPSTWGEAPKRLIRGTPSREMREDEIEAQRLYSDV